MPITKQAIKRMKQNRSRRINNKHYSSHMKSMIKLLLTYVEKGEMEKAKKILPDTIRAIDMAAKKNLIKGNNAARKKSRVQRTLNAGPVKKNEKAEKAVKKASKKVEEKATAEKAPAKEEATEKSDE